MITSETAETMPPTNTVPPSSWLAARAELLKREKEATALLTTISNERRNLPMVKLSDPGALTVFTDIHTGRKRSLLDLFEGRRQLVIYNQMPFHTDGTVGCPGCAFFSDHVPHGAALAHLHSRETTFVETAPEAPDKVAAFVQRMGWSFPFYALDLEALLSGEVGDLEENRLWAPERGSFKLDCFVKGDKDNEVYLTWQTDRRGVEPVLSSYALLDMTKLGRQDPPPGQPGFTLHDRYGKD